MRRFLLITLIFLRTSADALEPGLPELWWAAWHPVAAIRVKSISKKCDRSIHHKKIKTALDSFSAGGKADAFRHVFYMAAFAQKIKSTKKLQKLGLAHEKTNRRQFLRGKREDGELPDSLSSVMDLLNNDLGIAIGCANRRALLSELQDLVIDEIHKGRALIFLRNKKGEYLDCSEQPLDIRAYAGKWMIPKCLVKSDHDPKD